MALLAEMAFLNSRDLLQHLETKRLTWTIDQAFKAQVLLSLIQSNLRTVEMPSLALTKELVLYSPTEDKRAWLMSLKKKLEAKL